MRTTAKITAAGARIQAAARTGIDIVSGWYGKEMERSVSENGRY